MVADVHFSSARTDTGSDNWETPDDLFRKFEDAFGPFTLDAAASDTNHKCDKYFTEETDGLAQVWTGIVWCNPPYSQIKAWLRKGFESVRDRTAKRVVMLVPARTDTIAFQDYAKHGMVYFLKGRIKFVGAKHGAPFPSAIIVFDETMQSGIHFIDFR